MLAYQMLIPNKQVGDETNFDFAFFAPSRVMALDSERLTEAFSGRETIHLSSRR
jgi:hypothetical protein